jgi:hypothetical protein
LQPKFILEIESIERQKYALRQKYNQNKANWKAISHTGKIQKPVQSWKNTLSLIVVAHSKLRPSPQCILLNNELV